MTGYAQIETNRDEWELGALWVDPDFMRQGIGKLLVATAIDYAREHGKAILTVDSDPYAERFYLSVGAQRVGEVAAPIKGQPERVRPQLVLRAA